MPCRTALQCFYGVKELRNALQSYADAPAVAPAGTQVQSHRLTVATKNLFSTLERSAAPVIPGAFLQARLGARDGFKRLKSTALAANDVMIARADM